MPIEVSNCFFVFCLLIKHIVTDCWHYHPVGAFDSAIMLTLFSKRMILYMHRRPQYLVWELLTWGIWIYIGKIDIFLTTIAIYFPVPFFFCPHLFRYSFAVRNHSHFKCIRFVRANDLWFMEHQAIESGFIWVTHSTVCCQSIWLVTKENDWIIENWKYMQYSAIYVRCSGEGRILCAAHLLLRFCTGTNASEWIRHKGLIFIVE